MGRHGGVACGTRPTLFSRSVGGVRTIEEDVTGPLLGGTTVPNVGLTTTACTSRPVPAPILPTVSSTPFPVSPVRPATGRL